MTDAFDLVVIAVGIALGVTVIVLQADVLKKATKAKRRAARVVAIMGLVYFPFLMGWIAFAGGHVHGLAGQTLGQALYDQFIPFHEPEVDYHPLMILFYALVILANLNSGVLLMRAYRQPRSENNNTTDPPVN